MKFTKVTKKTKKNLIADINKVLESHLNGTAALFGFNKTCKLIPLADSLSSCEKPLRHLRVMNGPVGSTDFMSDLGGDSPDYEFSIRSGDHVMIHDSKILIRSLIRDLGNPKRSRRVIAILEPHVSFVDKEVEKIKTMAAENPRFQRRLQQFTEGTGDW